MWTVVAPHDSRSQVCLVVYTIFILIMLISILSVVLFTASVLARPQPFDAQPFAKVVKARQTQANTTGAVVDLGYAIYQGTTNSSTNLNVFTGWVDTSQLIAQPLNLF